MVHRIPGLLLGELEFVGNRFELLLRHALLQLSDSIVCEQSIWLYLVFGSQLIQGQTISGDRSIYHRPEVRVFLNNISLLSLLVNTFSCFEHLSQHLDSLSLNLSHCSFLVLSLLKSDHIDSLGMLVFTLLFSFNQG